MLNAHNHWTPGTCEHLSYMDICEYWHIYTASLSFESTKDFKKFVDAVIKSKNQKLLDSRIWAENFKKQKSKTKIREPRYGY